MIRIKVYKLSQIIKAAVIGLLAIAAITAGIILAVSGKGDAQAAVSGEASVQLDASGGADEPSQWQKRSSSSSFSCT